MDNYPVNQSFNKKSQKVDESKSEDVKTEFDEYVKENKKKKNGGSPLDVKKSRDEIII